MALLQRVRRVSRCLRPAHHVTATVMGVDDSVVYLPEGGASITLEQRR